MSKSSDFLPNWASTPGDTIADILRDKQLSLPRFAELMDSTIDHVRELLHGYISITDEIAKKLESILGASAEFWIRREDQYRASILRIKHVEEEKWVKQLPIKDMIGFGWIKDTPNLNLECLKYFQVPDVWTWRRKYDEVMGLTAFRKSQAYHSDPAAVAAWIRQGEIQARGIQCKPWNPEIARHNIPLMRKLTKKKRPEEFLPELTQLCAECGIALSIVRAPKGCSVSGATVWGQSHNNAIIILSFRYRSDDQFWFTFFHEIGHLLLHDRNKMFLEEGEETEHISKEEKEANDFSAGVLIPEKYSSRLVTMALTKRNLMDFAIEVDITLGILIGQLQHLKRIPPQNLNGYKRKYAWDDIS